MLHFIWYILIIAGIRGKSGVPTLWNFRKKFPETWIFENYEIMNETTTLKLNVPDSITTWRLTAFTINEITGFGTVDGPCDITALKPFFLLLNLPYSVKRGEIVSIPIVLHNYHNQSLDTEVIFYNHDQEFSFVESKRSQTLRGSTDQERLKRITVPANGIATVQFFVYPKRVGEINLRVTAKNPLDSDAILQKLKVEPEGVIKRHNKVIYVQIPSGGTYNTDFIAEIPGDIVTDSEYLTLSVGGDSVVPAINNLNGLVLLPTGCGEQNMVNFAPNVLVLDYLKAVGKYYRERKLVSKAKHFIEIGFQQQLTYRHDNGGYSVFGQKYDKQPSTWLTAYVVRFFIKASKYLSIEADFIESGLQFLSRQQLPNGDFPYTGYLFYPAQQNRYGFTSFVMMTFLEEEKYATKYQDTIAKALNFLNTNINRVQDTYALAIMAAALQKAKHENAHNVIAKLTSLKHQSHERVWWSQDDKNGEKDVEISAYVLMALLDGHVNGNAHNSEPREDLSIYKWLLDQRNERGGFKSTHDTVVGLQALVKFSALYGNLKYINLKLKYSAKNNVSEVLQSKELTIDGNNALILQTEELPKSTRALNIHVTGYGHSLVQLSYHYHVVTDKDQVAATHFHIQTTPERLNADEIQLDICFSYDDAMGSTDGNTTNMIIMETNLPSGYTTSDEFSNDLLENDIIQRIELKNSETTLVIYFEKLTANVKNCLNILANKVHDVLRRKPATIAIYDYYNISRHNIVFYSV